MTFCKVILVYVRILEHRHLGDEIGRITVKRERRGVFGENGSV
jgi:hypothetical protein